MVSASHLLIRGCPLSLLCSSSQRNPVRPPMPSASAPPLASIWGYMLHNALWMRL